MYTKIHINVISITLLKIASCNFLEGCFVLFKVELCDYVVGIQQINTTADDW